MYPVLLGAFTLLTFVVSCYVRCRRRTYNLVKNFADSLFTSSHWSPTPRGHFILCVPFLVLCVLHCVILPGPLIIVQRCEIHLSYLDMESKLGAGHAVLSSLFYVWYFVQTLLFHPWFPCPSDPLCLVPLMYSIHYLGALGLARLA